MRVFLSWSGTRSRQVASTLGPWLRTVLPGITTFMSEGDMQPGDRWSERLQDALSNADHGIVCMTPHNVDSPWLLFEAGAISNKSRAVLTPLLIDLDPASLPIPLRQFQGVTANRTGLHNLCRVLNSRRGEAAADEATLLERFAASYPAMEAALEHHAGPADELAIRSRERFASLLQFSQGLAKISQVLTDRNFHANVALGCGRSGTVLAGILATNLGIPHVVALDRIVESTLSQEIHYGFGGLVSLRKKPAPVPKVLVCAMLAETGETIDLTRRELRLRGWPSEPGEDFAVVAMFASESIRLRKKYVVIGVDGHHGIEALQNLPYMIGPYDFRSVSTFRPDADSAAPPQ